MFIYNLIKECYVLYEQGNLYISPHLSLSRGSMLTDKYINGLRGAVVKGIEHFLTNVLSQHLHGAGSSPAGSVGRDLNLQKLNYQYLTTIVAVVLVVC